MRKVVIIILEVLTIACWSGAFAVQYFTERKLGMARWVNYHYGKLTEAVPYDILKYALVALAAVAALLLAWRVWQRHGGSRAAQSQRRASLAGGACGGDAPTAGIPIAALVAIALAAVAVFAAVTLLVNHEVARADFLLVALCGLAALFQVVILACLASRAAP